LTLEVNSTGLGRIGFWVSADVRNGSQQPSMMVNLPEAVIFSTPAFMTNLTPCSFMFCQSAKTPVVQHV
jgi:hypothetical protein